MSTYVIGDVQGCLKALEALLAKIHYHPERDVLWFTGDLANRGPAPLATLRFIHSLPNSTVCVLGNHDFALLAADVNVISLKNDPANEILTAPDKKILFDWLKSRPLAHYSAEHDAILTHAGIYPFWDIHQTLSHAKEVEHALQSTHATTLFQHLYGNEPDEWSDSLTGWSRLRFIVNVLTRMRFLTPQGKLDFHAKGAPDQHANLIPWFLVPQRKKIKETILFGHWAALQGHTSQTTIYALDEGCVWGECLSALCLDTKQRFSVACHS